MNLSTKEFKKLLFVIILILPASILSGCDDEDDDLDIFGKDNESPFSDFYVYVEDSITGLPIDNADVEFWYNRYQDGGNEPFPDGHGWRHYTTEQTDEDGKVDIKISKGWFLVTRVSAAGYSSETGAIHDHSERGIEIEEDFFLEF